MSTRSLGRRGSALGRLEQQELLARGRGHGGHDLAAVLGVAGQNTVVPQAVLPRLSLYTDIFHFIELRRLSLAVVRDIAL